MPPRKIKVVDVLSSNEPEPVAAITDEPPEAENQPPEITPEPLEVVEPEVVEPEVVEPEVVEPEQPAQNVSTTKTVELVECPDCGKKMTMKTLKYSHAKNCTKNKKQQVEKEEEKEAEEEEEEVKQVVEQKKPKPPPPKLKRTESEKPPPTIKRTISKAPEPVKPTITNVYGREQRNERVKLKTLKMNTLFSNAF